jgi:hypothetical protein
MITNVATSQNWKKKHWNRVFIFMTILFPRAVSRIQSHNNTTTWEVPGPLINANLTYPKQSDFFGYLAPIPK